MDIKLIVLSIIILIGVLGVGPMLTIWSMNTLFNLGVAYSIKTWIATYFLVGVFSGKSLWKKIISVGAVGYIINQVKNWNK